MRRSLKGMEVAVGKAEPFRTVRRQSRVDELTIECILDLRQAALSSSICL
jgi:hypothetical protein